MIRPEASATKLMTCSIVSTPSGLLVDVKREREIVVP
jgi:hypothetical protein